MNTKVSSSTGYTIAEGTVHGTKKLVNDDGNLTGKIKNFRHKFTVWVKQTGDKYTFTVVDFEGIWKLGTWIKKKLSQNKN